MNEAISGRQELVVTIINNDIGCLSGSVSWKIWLSTGTSSLFSLDSTEPIWRAYCEHWAELSASLELKARDAPQCWLSCRALDNWADHHDQAVNSPGYSHHHILLSVTILQSSLTGIIYIYMYFWRWRINVKYKKIYSCWKKLMIFGNWMAERMWRCTVQRVDSRLLYYLLWLDTDTDFAVFIFRLSP